MRHALLVTGLLFWVVAAVAGRLYYTDPNRPIASLIVVYSAVGMIVSVLAVHILLSGRK